MRILFVSHYYSPEIGPAAKRISGLARNLKKKGHKVHILTGFPNYPTGRKPKEYRHKFYMREEVDGIPVYRYYMYASPNKNTLTRFLNYIIFPFVCFLFLFNNNEYDVVIGTSPPLFSVLPAYLFAKVKKIPFVFDIRDIWPDVAWEMGAIKKDSFVFQVFSKIADYLYSKADLITVVSDGKRKSLLNKGVSSAKVALISNGFDEEFLDSVEDADLINTYKLGEYFSLVYTGVIGYAQGLDVVVDAANLLRTNQDIQFLLVGDGYEKARLKEKAKQLGLSNIHFLNPVAPEKIFSFLNNAGASLVPLVNSNLKDSVPSKLYEALGVGCPVILGACGDSAQLLKDANGGVVVQPGDSKQLANAILHLKEKERDKEKALATRDYILKNYSRRAIAGQLEGQLKLIVNRG